MIAAVPYGQFVGGLINGALLLSVALWFFLLQPRSIRRKIARGRLSEVEGAVQLKTGPLHGVLWLVLAVCDLTITLEQADFFGDSLVSTVFVIAMAVIVFALVLSAMRKAKASASKQV